jgi:hypothetical protein
LKLRKIIEDFSPPPIFRLRGKGCVRASLFWELGVSKQLIEVPDGGPAPEPTEWKCSDSSNPFV